MRGSNFELLNNYNSRIQIYEKINESVSSKGASDYVRFKPEFHSNERSAEKNDADQSG
ncbi:hypothetical protein GCM10022209_54770 [Chitinophaga oryziterrae]